MPDLLVDTEVLVDHLRGSRALQLPEHGRAAYSTITRAELYAGTDEPAVVDRLLEALEELPFERRAAEEAGRLRRTLRIGLADAAIAATARVHSLSLVTRNVRHFRAVDGLELTDPSSLDR